MEWPATATTAASGRNRELLLGQWPAGCKARSRADAAAGCHNPFFVSEEKATGIPPSQRVPVKAYSALGASSAGFSPFLLTSADTFSTSSGSMARARSTLLEPVVVMTSYLVSLEKKLPQLVLLYIWIRFF